MIFPVLRGLIGFRRAPVTWLIVLMNVLVLAYSSSSGRQAQEGLDDLLHDQYFITTQGRIYAQYIAQDGHASEYPDFMKELATQVNDGETDRAEMLGQLAFRDSNFIDGARDLTYEGDQVAYRLWIKRLDDVKLYQDEHPSFTLGLNTEDASLTKWVTYIFVHSGPMHLIGNMLFLVIFGAALETQIGGLGFLVTFLLSGIFAAGTFALMTGVTSSPLVGASGAVSGVMTLYCFLNWSRPERYFYWLFLPLRGYMGFVFLPAWVAMVFWSLNDLSGYLGTLPELGGVAYTAHLGGEFTGLATGVILWALRRKWPVIDRPESARPIGVLYPFVAPTQINRRAS